MRRSAAEPRAELGVASPCTGVCAIDPATAACCGCGRTLDEIAAWPAADDPTRLRIVAAANARLAGRTEG